MEYKVIIAHNATPAEPFGQNFDSVDMSMERLTELVNEAIKEGWKCQGGVQMCQGQKNWDNYLYVTQAMVRE